jgi:hypothetical protein
VTSTGDAVPPHLGFLTVLQEAGGFLGGYLVTNLWGRPLEFRLSTAVQPNRVQQILYGETLVPYLCGEVIGKTLVEKTATPVQLVITDHAATLELRRCVDVPVVWVAPLNDDHGADLVARGLAVRPAASGRGPICVHPDFAVEVPKVREQLERLGGLDVTEPFARIREAIGEARRMGVTQRAG